MKGRYEPNRPDRKGAGPRFTPCTEAGYNLVAMVIAITILNVFIAVALPLWSTAAQRDKEEELIFRGMQYAEAIRIFQTRHGRLPIRLDELIKVKPRSIRQLWEDPMTEDGKWGVLLFQQSPQGRPLVRADAPPPRRRNPGQRGGTGPVTGPIQGVHSKSEEEAIKVFMGEDQYNNWRFEVGMVQLPAIVDPSAPLPRGSTEWFFRPFRQGLQPKIANPRNPVNSGLEQGNPGLQGGNPANPAPGANPPPGANRPPGIRDRRPGQRPPLPPNRGGS